MIERVQFLLKVFKSTYFRSFVIRTMNGSDITIDGFEDEMDGNKVVFVRSLKQFWMRIEGDKVIYNPDEPDVDDWYEEEDL